MKKYFPATKKQFSTLALGCALVALATLALVNCTDPTPPATFTVKFDTNGGIPAVADKTVEAGKLLAKPTPEPSKEGYTFVGWYKDEEFAKAFDFNTEKITDNITLYAKWTINSYTVTFDTNGGIPAVADKTVEAGKLLAKPTPEPSKEGYTFVGWYKDKALTQAFNFSSDKITQNTTLYVKWTINTYTVIFNANNEDATTSQSVEYGSAVAMPEPPTKDYHTFMGWYKDEEFAKAFDFNTEKITDNITLYAKWKSNLVTIPDANFKKKLQELIPGAFIRDSLDSESDDVTGRASLNVRYSRITDLTGIQYFTGLTQLLCYGNNLGTLDVSNNTALTQLLCYDNSLTALDVSNNTALATLNCYNNRLTALNVSNNTQLTVLNCGDNSLTVLDVSSNTALEGLSCANNRLTVLEVSNNTALATLNCYNNRLTVLEVSNNTQLTTLDCQKNLLTHLDIRGMRSIGDSFLIHAATGETNVIDTLKVHVHLKDSEPINTVKTDRGNKVTIETYSAAERSTAYALLCSDYDPTVGSETDRCGDKLKHTVVFNSRGGSLVDTLYLYYEGLISKPTNPTKADSTFAGWYKDEALTQAFDFNADIITQDTTLYARWALLIELTEANKHLLSRVDASGKATIAEGVVSIGALAFFEDSLTAVTIPGSVTEIGANAFQTNQLTSVTIPSGVTSIGDRAFAVNRLTSVTIPSSVTSIGDAAFNDNKLTSVTIPSSVINLGAAAFADNKLTSVTIPNGVTSIEGDTFSYNQLTSITIPSGVTSLEEGAFTNNPDLVTVTLTQKLYRDYAGSWSSIFGDQVETYQTHDGTKLNN